jgi:ubiquinone/menaquinone biosynthesis C-methylase UbiE
MTTIYGPTTWDVYARLDESLGPRGPEQLYDIAADHIQQGDTVLDIGCRDGTHLIELARRHPTITGIGVEPVAAHAAMARDALAAAADVADRVSVHQGLMHNLQAPDGGVDFVWCRDVLVQVDDVLSGLRDVARTMAPDARMLAYSSFATDRLDGVDLEMMRHHLGWIDANVRRPSMERAFRDAGLDIEDVVEIGTEWKEHSEERAQSTSKSLLRLSRLRRQRDDIVAWRGQEIYDHIEANLHYETFLFLGKLEPTVHLLKKA